MHIDPSRYVEHPPYGSYVCIGHILNSMGSPYCAVERSGSSFSLHSGLAHVMVKSVLPTALTTVFFPTLNLLPTRTFPHFRPSRLCRSTLRWLLQPQISNPRRLRLRLRPALTVSKYCVRENGILIQNSLWQRCAAPRVHVQPYQRQRHHLQPRRKVTIGR
jgi:hypothetical protein